MTAPSPVDSNVDTKRLDTADPEPTPEQRAASAALSRAIVAELREVIAREAEAALAAGVDDAAEPAA